MAHPAAERWRHFWRATPPNECRTGRGCSPAGCAASPACAPSSDQSTQHAALEHERLLGFDRQCLHAACGIGERRRRLHRLGDAVRTRQRVAEHVQSLPSYILTLPKKSGSPAQMITRASVKAAAEPVW